MNLPAIQLWSSEKCHLPSLAIAHGQRNQTFTEQKLMWDWANETVPTRQPELESVAYTRNSKDEEHIDNGNGHKPVEKPHSNSDQGRCKVMTLWTCLMNSWRKRRIKDKGLVTDLKLLKRRRISGGTSDPATPSCWRWPIWLDRCKNNHHWWSIIAPSQADTNVNSLISRDVTRYSHDLSM